MPTTAVTSGKDDSPYIFLLYLINPPFLLPLRPVVWGPSYRNSFYICIACAMAALLMSFIFRQHLKSLNRRFDEGEVDPALGKAFRYTV